jgi:hypothetical protein
LPGDVPNPAAKPEWRSNGCSGRRSSGRHSGECRPWSGNWRSRRGNGWVPVWKTQGIGTGGISARLPAGQTESFKIAGQVREERLFQPISIHIHPEWNEERRIEDATRSESDHPPQRIGGRSTIFFSEQCYPDTGEITRPFAGRISDGR